MPRARRRAKPDPVQRQAYLLRNLGPDELASWVGFYRDPANAAFNAKVRAAIADRLTQLRERKLSAARAAAGEAA